MASTWQLMIATGLLPAVAAVVGAVVAARRPVEAERTERAYHFAAGILFALAASAVSALSEVERQRLILFIGLLLAAALILAMEALLYSFALEREREGSGRAAILVARSVEVLVIGTLSVVAVVAEPTLDPLLIIALLVALFLHGLSTSMIFMEKGQGAWTTIGMTSGMAVIFLLVVSARMLFRNGTGG